MGPKRHGQRVDKIKDFRGTLIRLWKYVSPHRLSLFLTVVSAIIGVILMALAPAIMGRATTELFRPVTEGLGISGIDFSYIRNIILILIALQAGAALFGYAQQFIMAKVSQQVVYSLRKDVDEKVSRLPLKFVDAQTHGELISRFTNDIENISNTLQQGVIQVLTSAVTILAVLVIMLAISPLLTLVSILIVPISGFSMKALVQNSQKYFVRQQRIIGNLNGHIEEMFTGHQIVKAFNHEQASIETFEGINEELFAEGWKAQYFSGIVWPVTHVIGNLGFVAVAVLGGALVANGQIAIGNIQAFIQYNRQLANPIAGVAQIANMIQQSVASAERVFELLDEEEIRPDDASPLKIEAPKGEVVFENVAFGYSEGRPLLKDMNLKAAPGQMVAIVGPTGAGKTTLINLLLRFYEINQGRILIDGIDITRLKRQDLRTLFGMVLQDTWLFNGTIRENIAYGKPDATESDIIQSAKAAHAHHFIQSLPKGYDTVLNEEVSNISQGQKQLLTIARALLHSPQVMILDEATSSVDTRTEKQIQSAMKTLMKGRTSFVIAHRLSTIKEADLILVMKDGSVIEQGNHRELLEKRGFYFELHNSI
ncbi:MAG: ABC transporter ATP-binding protein/permease [Turicibacter sp.]|nr:ABC transporter ATP-binding protein/permease [Turicibacter sp.]